MRPTQPRIWTLCGWLAGLNPAIEIIRKFLANGTYAPQFVTDGANDLWGSGNAAKRRIRAVPRNPAEASPSHQRYGGRPYGFRSNDKSWPSTPEGAHGRRPTGLPARAAGRACRAQFQWRR